MKTRLLKGSGSVWPEITRATKTAARADVAVAFFGKDGAKRLPLKSGSRLVVDASEATVKGGSTCPAELLKLVRKGVEVYHCTNLHAKVFVFPKSVYVGSTNVSSHSESTLNEAVILTTDRTAVHEARLYVRGLPQERLGPEELERLLKSYREPKWSGDGKRRPVASVWLEPFEDDDYPPGSEDLADEAQSEAEKMLTRGFVLEEYWGSGRPRYKIGDTLIDVSDDVHGRHMVTPPARVIHTREWSNGRARYTFYYTERPKGNRIALGRSV